MSRIRRISVDSRSRKAKLNRAIGLGMILVILGFACLLGYLSGLLGPCPIKETVVSPIEECTHRNLSANVVRRESRQFSVSDSDETRRYSWWIVVTNPEGHRFEALLATDNSYHTYDAIRERRDISYGLSWDNSGKFLTCTNSAGEEGTVYFTGNFVFYAADPFVVSLEARPLTDQIKQRLKTYPDMTEAFSSISGYTILSGWCENPEVLNLRDDVLLLVQPDFRIRGTLMSFGPVILTGEADIKAIKAAKWVFADGKISYGCRITAERAFVLESQYSWFPEHIRNRMFKGCKKLTLIPKKDQPDE